MCPKGTILRKAYTTKNKVHVKATCIIDRGNPGKGPKILPELKKGTLEGYHYNNTELSRHRTLLKETRELGKSTVIKKLNAVAILTKNTNKKASNTFKKDLKYIQMHS